jgi:2-hydroxychromene-2-carboxylate isomerase
VARASERAGDQGAPWSRNTTAAREAGVFGVPTFVVDGTHLFWGQDRLELVAKTLAGWDPPR